MSINLDDLTIGQLKQLVNMAAQMGLTSPVTTAPRATHPYVGRYCIFRCQSAGVHAGELVSLDGDRAIVNNSRRLWYWKAKDGIALSGVAQHGLGYGCKIDVRNPQIALMGVIEVIPCSQDAEESIDGYVS